MKNRRKFASLLVAIQMLSLPQRGVMDAFMPDPFLKIYQNYTKEMSADPSLLLAGQKVFLNIREKRIEITFGRILYRQPGIIGRNTCVVEGKCPEWPKKELVVKISWPAVGRLSEVSVLDNITKAVAAAGKKASWVLNHIPTILHSQDFPLADNSPGMRLHNLLNDEDTPYAENTGSFSYELRVRRVIVQERLNPLTELTNQKDYAQVFFDVLQVHRWIYEFARILHRDISEGNIMWHKHGKKIYGVLNDFDLSSHREWPGQTSNQRTGTRPFMAYKLHKPTDIPVLPLYRHDLESLFYVLLIVVCGHSLSKVDKVTRLVVNGDTNSVKWHRWLTMNDKDLYTAKLSLMSGEEYAPRPSASFATLQKALQRLHEAFSEGFAAVGKRVTVEDRGMEYEAEEEEEDGDEGEEDEEEEDEEEELDTSDSDSEDDRPSAFLSPQSIVDEETLNGHVTYAVFYKALKHGLVRRFRPT